jgi:osmotically-inducible protein OsmY
MSISTDSCATQTNSERKNVMKKHLYKSAVILVLGCCFALAQDTSQPQYPQHPPAVPQTQQPPTTDQGTTDQSKASGNSADVQKDIQTALQKDESLASANISVQTTDKNVELSGTVPTQAAKDRAEQIAKERSGSLKIKNNIKVEEKPLGPKS